jgi:pilus assembly protein Flp/PilA
MILKSVQQFFQADEAATAAEYAVLLALILLALISAITAVGNSTSGLWSSDTNRISAACNGS